MSTNTEVRQINIELWLNNWVFRVFGKSSKFLVYEDDIKSYDYETRKEESDTNDIYNEFFKFPKFNITERDCSTLTSRKYVLVPPNKTIKPTIKGLSTQDLCYTWKSHFPNQSREWIVSILCSLAALQGHFSFPIEFIFKGFKVSEFKLAFVEFPPHKHQFSLCDDNPEKSLLLNETSNQVRKEYLLWIYCGGSASFYVDFSWFLSGETPNRDLLSFVPNDSEKATFDEFGFPLMFIYDVWGKNLPFKVGGFLPAEIAEEIAFFANETQKKERSNIEDSIFTQTDLTVIQLCSQKSLDDLLVFVKDQIRYEVIGLD